MAYWQAIDKDDRMDNPFTSWLPDASWDSITELDKLPKFHGIVAYFEHYPRDWNLWFTHPEPENAPLPGLCWSVGLTLLQSSMLKLMFEFVSVQEDQLTFFRAL